MLSQLRKDESFEAFKSLLSFSQNTFLMTSLSLFYLQNVLFAIGSAFLYYVNHFKLYSSFCASHSKAQKVLHPSKDFKIRILLLNAKSDTLVSSCQQMKAIKHYRNFCYPKIRDKSTAALWSHI